MRTEAHVGSGHPSAPSEIAAGTVQEGTPDDGGDPRGE
jgi:hypothetical protein